MVIDMREGATAMLARSVTTLGTALAATALLLATALIWLVLKDPAAVAGAVDGGKAQTVIQAVIKVIVHALERVAQWL